MTPDKELDIIKKIALLMEEEIPGNMDADKIVDAFSAAISKGDAKVELEQPSGEKRDLSPDAEHEDKQEITAKDANKIADDKATADFKSQLDVETAIDVIRILKQQLKTINCKLADWYVSFSVRGFDITNLKIICDNLSDLRKNAPENPDNKRKTIGDTILALRTVYQPFKEALQQELKLDCKGFEYDKADTGAFTIFAMEELDELEEIPMPEAPLGGIGGLPGEVSEPGLEGEAGLEMGGEVPSPEAGQEEAPLGQEEGGLEPLEPAEGTSIEGEEDEEEEFASPEDLENLEL